jgi:hypothetical protein
MDTDLIAKMHAEVDSGKCPICKKTYGIKEKRHTVMQHMRVSKEAGHVVWKAKWYKIMFPHGHFCNPPAKRDALIRALREEIKRVYGEAIYRDVFHAQICVVKDSSEMETL